MDAKTLKEAIRKSGFDNPAANEAASYLLDFFGFEKRIVDNHLHQDDRTIFYLLEEKGLLKTEKEETTLYDGREWRIHYWLLKEDHITNLASKPEKEAPIPPSLYENEEFWNRPTVYA